MPKTTMQEAYVHASHCKQPHHMIGSGEGGGGRHKIEKTRGMKTITLSL